MWIYYGLWYNVNVGVTLGQAGVMFISLFEDQQESAKCKEARWGGEGGRRGKEALLQEISSWLPHGKTGAYPVALYPYK